MFDFRVIINMKTVYYIRHAKSSWDDINQRDHDRPLNNRGRRDAPFMAKKLNDREQGIKVDGVLCSTAERTKETLSYFVNELNIPKDKIIFDENLYHAGEDVLIESLYQLPPETNNILLFAHNPGLTFLVNLIDEGDIDNVPTCGIFKVYFQTKSWQKVDIRNGSLEYLIYPKMFKKI